MEKEASVDIGTVLLACVSVAAATVSTVLALLYL